MVLSRRRFLWATLALQTLALAAASTVWQHLDSEPFVTHTSLCAKGQPRFPWPMPISVVASGYNETTALYLAHVTSVAYCQDHHIIRWNCQPCAFVPPLKDVTVVEDAHDAFQGLVGYSQLYDALVVTFRGSMDVTNWLDNLTFLKRRPYSQFPNVMVHQGFYWAYRSVSLQVTSALHKLQEQYPYASLMIAGHSLGGAVAAICAFELEYIEKIPVKALYTFGKPRVGNTEFSAKLQNASMAGFRVTHFQDIVPHLPPTWTGFKHTSEEVRCCHDRVEAGILRYRCLCLCCRFSTTSFRQAIKAVVKQMVRILPARTPAHLLAVQALLTTSRT